KQWADLCKTFLQEARWNHNNITPSFEDYFENAWRSVSGCLILTQAYFLLAESITEQEIDLLQSYHEILRWPSIIFRLCNDLGTSSAEISSGK
ncbi:putative terpene synthase 12, partial [Turnera subulata]